MSRRIGYVFRDRTLLVQAVSHRSWCAEHPGNPSNERLEFLGDAVLGWVIADEVYRAHDHLPEGQLTDARKAVVNANALAEMAQEVDLGPALLLGKGEDAAGGRSKPSILSDALEAVLGAVYLDGGVEHVRAVIEQVLGARLRAAIGGLGARDHKTALQELTARLFEGASGPAYQVRDEGPDHAKRFFATVLVGGVVQGEGEGRSKKQAEQSAAADALSRLDHDLAGRS